MIDPAENLTPTIDCTDVVENIVNKSISAQNDKLNKIINAMEIQQQQFTNIITAFTRLTEELKNAHNPQYQPPSPSGNQQQNSTSVSSSHHCSHNALVETRHPNNNALAEAQHPHSATTTEAQQNLQHHNTSAGV